jgi:hypothetical protein
VFHQTQKCCWKKRDIVLEEKQRKVVEKIAKSCGKIANFFVSSYGKKREKSFGKKVAKSYGKNRKKFLEKSAKSFGKKPRKVLEKNGANFLGLEAFNFRSLIELSIPKVASKRLRASKRKEPLNILFGFQLQKNTWGRFDESVSAVIFGQNTM